MKRFRNMKLFPRTFCFLLFLFAAVILVSDLFIAGFLLRDAYYDLKSRADSLSGTIATVELADCDAVLEAGARNGRINVTARWDGVAHTYVGAEEARGGKTLEWFTITDLVAVTRDGAPILLEVGISTRALTLILSPLPMTSLIALLLSILFAYLYSKAITSPIREILRGTEAMEELCPEARCAVDTRDELGDLARQINALYARLRQTIDSLEREKAYIAQMEQTKVDFLRAASHELKTPLAGLRITLENMKYNVGKYRDHDTYLQESLDTVDRLTAMIREILDSSRMPGGGRAETLSAAEEIAAVWKDYELQARAKRLDVTMDVAPDVTVEMDRTLFRRVWSNLLSNAVRYTDEGGQIRIRGTKGELSVWNSCVPLTREQTARIFEAFYRPDFARSERDGGSGLGLYLVREILTANGLDCAFRPDGAGMRFTMGKPARGDNGQDRP